MRLSVGLILERMALPSLAALSIGALLPGIANAASCKAHFEIRYGSFKVAVPADHFEAHDERRKGETDNEVRRRAREKAQACMSGLWRDRIKLQNGDPSAAPECRIRLHDSTVIRPISTASMDLKRQLEIAACTAPDSNIKNSIGVTVKVYKRTHGDRGCGPNLQTVESRFLTDYTLDCVAVRAREGFKVKETGLNEEFNWDRPGMDIQTFPVNSQNKCRDACKDNGNCRAWTWVKDTHACWLKNGVPWAKRNDCCVSGVIK